MRILIITNILQGNCFTDMVDCLLKQYEKCRILVCKDVDGQSASKIAEKFVPLSPIFDAVILCGPFVHELCDTAEQCAVAEADISSIIAQFENIVCRVMYLPADGEVGDSNDQPHLTPNSVCIDGRQLQLLDNLFVMGMVERSKSVSKGPLPADVDRSAESDEETENVAVESGLSVSVIKEMLDIASDQASVSSGSSGMFALSYKYSHTLNQLLFHMTASLEAAGINLCIISSDQEEATRLPTKFGGLWLAAAKSLRVGGHYMVVEMERDSATRRWSPSSINTHNLSESYPL